MYKYIIISIGLIGALTHGQAGDCPKSLTPEQIGALSLGHEIVTDEKIGYTFKAENRADIPLSSQAKLPFFKAVKLSTSSKNASYGDRGILKCTYTYGTLSKSNFTLVEVLPHNLVIALGYFQIQPDNPSEVMKLKMEKKIYKQKVYSPHTMPVIRSYQETIEAYYKIRD